MDNLYDEIATLEEDKANLKDAVDDLMVENEKLRKLNHILDKEIKSLKDRLEIEINTKIIKEYKKEVN